MSALVKVYTDAAHTSEVAHTTMYQTSISTALTAGGTVINVANGSFWPTSGWLDIVDGVTGNETLAYYGLVNNSANIANTGGFAHNHAASAGVIQWTYNLPVGDQVNGIPNDGTQAGITVQNVTTWYLYNAGDQPAQSLTIGTASQSSSTQGFADSLVSFSTAATSYSTSNAPVPVNLAALTTQEFWVASEVPSGQSAAGNPQFCTININYSSI
jgi:hypothetical protein